MRNEAAPMPDELRQAGMRRVIDALRHIDEWWPEEETREAGATRSAPATHDGRTEP